MYKRGKHERRGVELVGWYGVAAILGAYFLLVLGLVEVRSMEYQLLNISGALSIIYHSYERRDFQPVLLNVIWLIIALIGLSGVTFG